MTELLIPKKYSKLDKVENLDMEAVREFADAINELKELMQRVSYLKTLIKDNIDYKEFVWVDKIGNAKAIADLDDNHIKNISLLLLKNGTSNKNIYSEMVKRFGKENVPLKISDGRKNPMYYTTESEYDEDVPNDYDDISWD